MRPSMWRYPPTRANHQRLASIKRQQRNGSITSSALPSTLSFQTTVLTTENSIGRKQCSGSLDKTKPPCTHRKRLTSRTSSTIGGSAGLRGAPTTGTAIRSRTLQKSLHCREQRGDRWQRASLVDL